MLRLRCSARQLDDEANKKGEKWGANDEAAATSGVIQFLQKYMKGGGQIKRGKPGNEMKGEAARLALTAFEFANKCGGVTLSLHGHGKVAAADEEEDEEQEEDAAAPVPAAKKKPTTTELRWHDKAVRGKLVDGEKLYGRIKYLQEYKLDISFPPTSSTARKTLRLNWMNKLGGQRQ
jgi:hypothetical protein